MRIFDFLRKFKSKEKKENQENFKKEQIDFSELEKWLEKKARDIESKEEEIFALVKKEIENFSDNIKGKIKTAEEFDLEAKKADEKFKSVSKDGRKKYIESVEQFIEQLEKLEKKNLEETIFEINRLFSGFQKESARNYERATVLIGKEMRDIRETLKNFSDEVLKIFEENKHVSDNSKIILAVKSNIQNLERNNEELKNLEKEMNYLDEKTRNLEKERQNNLKELNEIRESPEYLEIENKKEKINSLKSRLEKDIMDLKEDIDFKALGNFYHIFEDKMKIVNSHRNDFHADFHKDNGKSISELIESAKLGNKNIIERIEKIAKNKEEILRLENETKKEELPKKVDELYSVSVKALSEAEELKNRRDKRKTKFGKIKEDKENILSKIKEDAGKLNLDILD